MNARTLIGIALAWATCAVAPGDDLLQIEPAWEYATRSRIAVAPVQIDLRAAGPRATEAAAARATQALSDWLRRSGAFDVASEDVGQRVAQGFHLPRVAETAVGQRALPEKFAPQVDAVVIATLTSASIEIVPTRVERPKYEMKDDELERDSLNRPIVLGRENVTLLRKVGRAGGVVQVLDAQTGVVLLRHETAPIEIVHETVAPDTTVQSLDLAERAGEQLGIDWARQVGPTRVEIDFDNDMLLTAHAWVDDRYDESDQIAPGQGQFIVALRNLPASAARLPFVLSLVDDDEKQIWQQGLAWTDDGRAARGAWFAVPVQLLKDSGHDEFQLQLYGPGVAKPLAKHNFDLQVP